MTQSRLDGPVFEFRCGGGGTRFFVAVQTASGLMKPSVYWVPGLFRGLSGWVIALTTPHFQYRG